MNGSAAEIRGRIQPWIGVVEPLDDDHCVLTIGGDTCDSVAALIVQAGVEFTLLGPMELAQPLRETAARLLRGSNEPAA